MSAWLLLPALLLAGAALAAWRMLRRSRQLDSEELVEAQLAELRRALRWLDWEVPTATTLLGLERRLGRTAGPAAGRYAAALRAHRYDPEAPDGPTLQERRGLRRDLTARARPEGPRDRADRDSARRPEAGGQPLLDSSKETGLQQVA